MVKVNSWIQDMERSIEDAIDFGAKSMNDIMNFVKTDLGVADESFVRSYAEDVLGFQEETLTWPSRYPSVQQIHRF